MDQASNIPNPRMVYDFYGNETLEEEICKTLNSSRMHHAWIFHGSNGIGKTTMAYRVARYFLGAKTNNIAPLSTDANDPISIQIENDSCPDLRVANLYCPEEKKIKSVVSVHAIRELNQLFQHRANNEFGRRVAIIENADRMNENAANALLKTLEEPPPGALIILIVDNLGSLLQTIKSRCRIFEFRAIRLDALKRHIPNASIASLVLSNGGFGRAKYLNSIDIDELYIRFSNAIGAFPKQNKVESQKLANFATDNEKLEIVFDLINDWIKRATRAAIGLHIDEIEPGESANMARIASNFSEGEWFNIMQNLEQMRRQIETNLDKIAAVLNIINSLFFDRVTK